MSAASRPRAAVLALLVLLSLVPVLADLGEEAYPPPSPAPAAGHAPAPPDVSWYLDNRGVAAGPLERATRPPWDGMQRRAEPEAPLFEGAPPELLTEHELCCLDPDTWPVLTHIEQREFREALPLAGTLLREEPANDLCRLLFARAARELGQPDEALREFQLLAARAPGLQEAQVSAGELLSRQGRHDEALAALDRALAIASTPAAHLARGTALVMAGKIDQAEWDLWKAAEGSPSDGRAYYALAWLAAWRRQPAQVIYLLRFAARDEAVFRERINRRRLAADTGLLPVREHPGFVQYLSQLPAEPQVAGATAGPAAR